MVKKISNGNPSRKYVYISYSHMDNAFVAKLANALGKSGIDIWYDKMEIEPGGNWRESIEHALTGTSIMLFISSRNSLESKWTLFELDKMKSNGSFIIPIILDDYGAKFLPEFLRDIQWVDFRGYKIDEELFIKNINNIIKGLASLGFEIKKDKPILKHKNKSKGYFFISYCDGDYNFVVELRKFLKNNGYGYWDYNVNERNYQSLFYLELEETIKNAAATLSVLSNEWKSSEWTVKEYIFSNEVKIPVFLLMAKRMQPTLVIAGLPYIDFTIDKNEGFTRLKRGLSRNKL